MSDIRPRFVLIPESTSQHCCFQWSIEDRSTGKQLSPENGGMIMYETVCEGFDEEYGALVLEALNRG